MHKINTYCDGVVWFARLESNKNMYGTGKTQKFAIGDLIANYGFTLGIDLTGHKEKKEKGEKKEKKETREKEKKSFFPFAVKNQDSNSWLDGVNY